MNKFWFLIFFISGLFLQAQEDTPIIIKDTITEKDYYQIAIQPTKATFYSAVLPGLGQAYNKDYWKIPVVYAALGSGIYFYKFNNDKFHEYRDAYILMKMGQPNAYDYLSEDVLERAQVYHKKYRDLSAMITALLYVMQVVEASVDAHLRHLDTEPDLTLHPTVIPDYVSDKNGVGISVQYRF